MDPLGHAADESVPGGYDGLPTVRLADAAHRGHPAAFSHRVDPRLHPAKRTAALSPPGVRAFARMRTWTQECGAASQGGAVPPQPMACPYPDFSS